MRACDRIWRVVRLSIPGLPHMIKGLVIPDTIKGIAVFSFAGCETLEVLSFATNSNIEILNGFEACGLRELRIPPSVMDIDEDAFAECRQFALIAFEGISQIRIIDGFRSCPISTINLPRSVEFIGRNGLADCEFREQVTFEFEPCLHEIHGFSSSRIRNVTIPSRTELIGPSAFSGSRHLTVMEFPADSQIRAIDTDCCKTKAKFIRFTFASEPIDLGILRRHPRDHRGIFIDVSDSWPKRAR
jgi:hypothetical protein